MSGSQKKRAVEISYRDETSSDGFSEEEKMETTAGCEEIQVDFEGRNPIDSDFHGIRQLLRQLFLKAHINLSDLTNLIIGQNYVGSVVKQSEIDDESGDEDESDVNDVFGITTIVNLTEKQHLECIEQLRNLLKDLCQEHGTDQSNAYVRSLLSDTKTVGLLINERFVNIPAQISVPLLESLVKEIERAKEKKLPFDFSYILLISKLYKVDSSAEKKKKKKGGKNKNVVNTDEPEIIWTNLEEQLFDEEADCRFEFSVKGESDSGLSGQWLEDDVQMTPYRRVLILSADKLERVVQRIKDHISQQ